MVADPDDIRAALAAVTRDLDGADLTQAFVPLYPTLDLLCHEFWTRLEALLPSELTLTRLILSDSDWRFVTVTREDRMEP
jgi:6-pyruvoyl-tetrahydropterin synthase